MSHFPVILFCPSVLEQFLQVLNSGISSSACGLSIVFRQNLVQRGPLGDMTTILTLSDATNCFLDSIWILRSGGTVPNVEH